MSSTARTGSAEMRLQGDVLLWPRYNVLNHDASLCALLCHVIRAVDQDVYASTPHVYHFDVSSTCA
jgi:hypothetical protein